MKVQHPKSSSLGMIWRCARYRWGMHSVECAFGRLWNLARKQLLLWSVFRRLNREDKSRARTLQGGRNIPVQRGFKTPVGKVSFVRFSSTLSFAPLPKSILWVWVELLLCLAGGCSFVPTSPSPHLDLLVVRKPHKRLVLPRLLYDTPILQNFCPLRGKSRPIKVWKLYDNCLHNQSRKLHSR